jgi:transposase
MLWPMTLAIAPFTDVEALRAAFAAQQALLTAERVELTRISSELAIERAEKARVIEQNDRLRQIIRDLQRQQFGRRSERIDPDQLALALEELEQAAVSIVAEQEKRSPAVKAERARRQGPGRASLPAHLPRVEVVVEPEDMACPCCGGALHVIGEDRSERLDVIPAQYQVIVTRRPKYACRRCAGAVVQAAAPARLIEGGLPTEQLVADVVVRKYADHCPLYRQAQILARQGIAIDRATLAFWVGYASAELKPLWRRLHEMLLASAKLFVDETRAPVLDPGRGRTKTGYLWTLARDDRPWGGSEPPAVLYSYAPGRGAEHAVALLQGFAGVLQTDGYAAYKGLTSRPGSGVSLAHCWAHVRRKFYDIAQGGSSPVATEALQRIALLYHLEAEIHGQSAEARRAVRQARAKPLVEALKAWWLERLAEVSGKSVIAQAIRYALGLWDGLTRFLDDGRVEIDSNTVERSMRPIALNRKNALFAGGDQGGENWALLASLIETCKLNSVNPQVWLTDVLTKLVNNWPNNRLDELMPWAWKAVPQA